MYCPACAAQSTDEISFCRTCGGDLREVRAVVKKGLSSTLIKEVTQLDEALKQKNKLNIRRNLLNIFFGIFLIITFVLTGTINSVAAILSISIFCLIIGVGIGVQKYRARLLASNRRTELPSAANSKERLQSDLVPDILTEGTTRQLNANYKTKE